MRISRYTVLGMICALGSFLTSTTSIAGPENTYQLVNQAILAKPGSGVQEVSTSELQQILRDQSVLMGITKLAILGDLHLVLMLIVPFQASLQVYCNLTRFN